MADGGPRVEIAVTPATELAARRRLFDALEDAYPVQFVPFAEKTTPPALVVLGAEPPSLPDVPTLVLADSGRTVDGRTTVEFAADPLVPAPFRGRSLVDEETSTVPIAAQERTTVLARTGRDAVWTAASGAELVHHAGVVPSELNEGERLRDRLRPGRYLALLPLVHFLQQLTGTARSNLQACFVIDDPNLHALTYGHVSYPALARHADTHGYHVAMAMIPLDGWFTSGDVASLFRAEHARLSLLVHGNDHVRGELAQARSVTEATAVAAQALRRIESFERRTGVRVSRAMAPPHGACSVLGARGMLRAGFAALCTNPAPRAPEADVSLVDWRLADFVAGGLPNISRYHIDQPRDDLTFRAFLGQPLVLYLHHDDLRAGLDLLADAARDVATCGRVDWMSVGDLAEMQLDTTVASETAFVRLFARRARLEVPEGVSRVVVELPGHGEWQRETLEVSHLGSDSSRAAAFHDGRAEIDVESPGELFVALRHADAVRPGTLPNRRTRPWPLVRRLLTEGRDRLAPTLHR